MREEELFATALEIRILAKMLASLATRSVEQHLQANGAPISPLQHGVMRLLYRHQHTSSELSRKMHIDPATLVPVVDALERHGYVRRGKDPADRRRNPLLLTEEGVELLARVPMFNRSDVLVGALESLGDQPSRELLRLLRELVAHMGGDGEVAYDLASIAETARTIFSAQAGAAAPAPPAAAEASE